MNIKHLAKIQGLTVDEFLEIVVLLIDTTKKDIAKIKTAGRQQEATIAGDAAHSIKGAAGNMGFVELSETAKNIEQLALNGELSLVLTNVEKLVEQTIEIEVALNREAG